MDTALITFMLQSSPNAQSVDLIGSWDNFSKHYPMERDVKRSRNHWRGCYTFHDIICDGDGGNSPRRSGGLKMGSTYYYYYEIDGGSETYDPSIPFTTSCPYLPGQPVNLLYVPIEIQPLRHRSASTSAMTIADIMTMNPSDKFMAPRAPPPTPPLPRLNTSSTVLLKRRKTRSVSPDAEKSPWSRRNFFGLRSPACVSACEDRRGRSSSVTKAAEASAESLYSALTNRSDDLPKVRSVPHTRNPSPQSFGRSSREPSPLRTFPRDSSSYYATSFEIPDEIAEEAEECDDDENFAHHLARISMSERGIVTGLSPPPARIRSPASPITSTILTTKPLPQLPNEALLPSPLRIHAFPSISSTSSASSPIDKLMMPRSHFSTSTIATQISSPTESNSASYFSETPSMSDSHSISHDEEEEEEEVDLTADDTGSGDEDVSARSTLAEETDWRGFSGYSLPEVEFASELTLRKGMVGTAQLMQAEGRKTFGEGLGGGSADGSVAVPVGVGAGMDVGVGGVGMGMEGVSAMEQLLSEMGYLGDFILRKEVS